MEGLISAAAARYHRGDKGGAATAAASLMARYPGDRRVLHAAVSLGALSNNIGMTEQASRLLQASSSLLLLFFLYVVYSRRTVAVDVL